ncbi:MAG: hypothetical protein AAFY51_06215 [Pseudomonadota bacterium]
MLIRIVPCLVFMGLAACSADSESSATEALTTSGSTNPPNELSAESLKMAETAWLSVSEDGVAYTTLLDPDGRYRDLLDGDVAFTGSWEQTSGGVLCFMPDDAPSTCWSHGAPGLNGVMRAKNGAGREIALKQIAYTPPAAPQSDEAEAESEGDETNLDR